MCSLGIVIKADTSQLRGREFEPQHRIPDGYYVDCFIWPNPPASLE